MASARREAARAPPEQARRADATCALGPARGRPRDGCYPARTVSQLLHLRPAHDRSLRGVSLLGRWILVLLLAFDLVGSPFHAHAHDLGADAAARHAAHAVDAVAGVPHVEENGSPAFGHSLAALRNPQPQVDPHASIDEAPPSRADIAVPPPALVSLDDACCAMPPRAARPRDLHIRPDGRAPPSPLHS